MMPAKMNTEPRPVSAQPTTDPAALTDKLRRAARRKDFVKWRVKFYREHVHHVRGDLIPEVETFCGAAWALLAEGEMPEFVVESIGAYTQEMAERHVQTSRGLVATDMSEMASGFAQWENERPTLAAENEIRGLTEMMRSAARIEELADGQENEQN